MTALPTYPLTFDDLLLMPEDGKRRELIDGAMVVSPPPEWRHQNMSGVLYQHFVAANTPDNEGMVLMAPVGVEFWPGTVLEPDLVYISPDRFYLLDDPRKITGAPDIVVEILSPASRKYDRETKLALYERAGVPEYWIVDPPKRTFEVFSLINGVYQPVAANPGGSFTSPRFPALTIDPVTCFKRVYG